MKALADILKECEAIKFGDFVLSSGKKSKYYIDIKKATTQPEILRSVARSVIETMKKRSISANYIGCVALGGVPVGVAVSLGTGLPLLILRKEKKEYGTKGQVIGGFEKGKSVVLVEDVTTTGGSVMSAITILRDEGLIIDYVITVVDREEGASNSLSDIDVELIPLISISDLLKK